jgi:hypothetical protein
MRVLDGPGEIQPWWPLLKKALGDGELWGFFLASRLFYFFSVGTTSLLAAHLNAAEIGWPDAEGWVKLLNDAFFSADSHWYWSIVHNGYEHRPYAP